MACLEVPLTGSLLAGRPVGWVVMIVGTVPIPRPTRHGVRSALLLGEPRLPTARAEVPPVLWIVSDLNRLQAPQTLIDIATIVAVSNSPVLARYRWDWHWSLSGVLCRPDVPMYIV